MAGAKKVPSKLFDASKNCNDVVFAESTSENIEQKPLVSAGVDVPATKKLTTALSRWQHSRTRTRTISEKAGPHQSGRPKLLFGSFAAIKTVAKISRPVRVHERAAE